MMNRMGVAWRVVCLGLSLAAVGCGDDAKSDDDSTSGGEDAGAASGDSGGTPSTGPACDPKKLPKLPATGLGYPDSYCGPEGCVADACDPLGRCQPACNAWALVGKVSFQAVTMSDDGKAGPLPMVKGKAADDICPENMTTPKGADVNCCQRGDNTKVEQPALKLTSLTMTRPTYFAADIIGGVNKEAIEQDRYNWVSVFSSGEDGEITATSGNAHPNTDGTFTSVAGPFSIGGKKFNEKGIWDAQPNIPVVLSTEGDIRMLDVGPTSSVKDYVMVMWLDNTYSFARLELHMRGLRWTMPVSKDLSCAGERQEGGQFDQVGELRGFVPLDAAIKTEVWLSTDNSQNLCTSMSGAADCRVPVSKWTPG